MINFINIYVGIHVGLKFTYVFTPYNFVLLITQQQFWSNACQILPIIRANTCTVTVVHEGPI